MKFWRLLLLVLLLAAVACAAAATWWLDHPLPLNADSVEADVEAGATPRAVADAWVRAGVQTSPLLLYEWFRWSGQSRKIRAGSYALERGATPRTLLAKMVRGDETLAFVRITEGWTFRQVRQAIEAAEGLQPKTASMTDAQLMEALGAPGLSPEGQFFPDTYAYSKGSSDLAVLRRAHRLMSKHLEDAWARRAPDTPLKSPQEALILASIVEKETGAATDRGKVAAVFSNRLRKGMPLQTDPTVIYGLGESFDGDLKKRHLTTDGPYNTYLRPGLPPTPIAMPGEASLAAAVAPDPIKALYFVARGDGTTQFSNTLAEHNRAVDQYQRNRK